MNITWGRKWVRQGRQPKIDNKKKRNWKVMLLVGQMLFVYDEVCYSFQKPLRRRPVELREKIFENIPPKIRQQPPRPLADLAGPQQKNLPRFRETSRNEDAWGRHGINPKLKNYVDQFGNFDIDSYPRSQSRDLRDYHMHRMN